MKHMVPTFLSHIIATGTLSIPAMIVNETSLSFLGLGLRPPAISYGVMLQEAQNVQTMAKAPWLMLPGLVLVINVLMFNLIGDGLRDAADPYSKQEKKWKKFDITGGVRLEYFDQDNKKGDSDFYFGKDSTKLPVGRNFWR